MTTFINTKILNNYSNSVALDGNPDLVHATGCKQPRLRYKVICKGVIQEAKRRANDKNSFKI
jgi:hypothetical protein